MAKLSLSDVEVCRGKTGFVLLFDVEFNQIEEKIRMSLLGLGIQAMERGWVPDRLVRSGIRRLLRQRLKLAQEQRRSGAEARLLQEMTDGPIAKVPEKANEQHYEVPAAFFGLVLGPRKKYSSCFYESARSSLGDAEEQALRLTCQRAQLEDGQAVLELGCGWGSLSLFMAQQFPHSQFTSVSNSNSQRKFIESKCRELGLSNLEVITADMNDFRSECSFDRVVSVEMFEHMRNYEQLLASVAQWLKPAGKLFVHIFCHREYCYPFETGGQANWMGKYFFTGGIMPSQDIFESFGKHMVVEQRLSWNGKHYQRTQEDWLANLDANKSAVLKLFAETYGQDQASIWFNRWRVFFLACSELFGFADGEEWFVSHYLLSPVGSANEC